MGNFYLSKVSKSSEFQAIKNLLTIKNPGDNPQTFTI